MIGRVTIMLGQTRACTAVEIGRDGTELLKNRRVAAHDVAVPAAVVLVDEPHDLADGGIGQGIDVVGRLDVDVHDDVAGKTLEDILKGGDAQAGKLRAMLETEVEL